MQSDGAESERLDRRLDNDERVADLALDLGCIDDAGRNVNRNFATLGTLNIAATTLSRRTRT